MEVLIHDIQDVTDSQRQRGGGKGALVKTELAPCLATENVATLFVFSDSSTSWEENRDARSRADSYRQPSRDEVRFVNGDGLISGVLAAEPGMKQQNYIFIER